LTDELLSLYSGSAFLNPKYRGGKYGKTGSPKDEGLGDRRSRGGDLTVKEGRKIHGSAHALLRRIEPHSSEEFKHWDNFNEMHEVLDRFPGYFKALLLELMDKPMSREQMGESVTNLEMRLGKRHRGNLDVDLAFAVERGVLKEKERKFYLTSGGREIAEHMQKMIPLFMGTLFSPNTVSIVTVAVHILLSVLKLFFAFISGSAGLIADGIDNSLDTVSSILVWLGIRFDKEKMVSIFIMVMMFVSVGGVTLASYNKIANPEPIKEGVSAFVISLVCGIVMLLISAYQYTVGRRNNNFAILCQAIDSRNHFLVSLLVCSGIILSKLADTFTAKWLYYADAAVSIVIGLLILKSVFELIVEMAKPSGEELRISHFWGTAQERLKRSLILHWLIAQLREGSIEAEVLNERFVKHFCQQTPKIVALSGLGYHPDSSADLDRYLELFVKQKKLKYSDGRYRLIEIH
jgi:hypothetical protein